MINALQNPLRHLKKLTGVRNAAKLTYLTTYDQNMKIITF